jgi:A/G-specific adenine glycosylase
MDGRVDETTGYPTDGAGPADAGAGPTRERAATPGHKTPPSAAAALLAWHATAGRPLAIRGTTDPWAILVAEVMSQQTRIDRVEGHWRRFLALYPAPAALAAAPLRDVVLAWSGLGYNRRAAALRGAARAIVERHGGSVPRTVAELDALPGIGPYTARATAATAFRVPVAAVDVNVRRVVERLAGGPLRPAEAQRRADALVDPERPDLWTHAAMDLAATVCRRREPLCDACPLAGSCRSRGTEGEAPRRRGTAAAFPTTRRWLRGRILAEVAAADGWHAVEGGRGSHAPAAVREAVESLAREGLFEIDRAGRVRIA